MRCVRPFIQYHGSDVLSKVNFIKYEHANSKLSVFFEYINYQTYMQSLQFQVRYM